MPLNPDTLDSLSRLELLRLAQQLSIADADVMTRPELRAAIRSARSERARPDAKSATWLGVARRLLASVVEQGLNLPDAASMIRGDVDLSNPPVPPPVATVTLARIYAAQGHLDRAIGTLRQVLEDEPDHAPAAELLALFSKKAGTAESGGPSESREESQDTAESDVPPRPGGPSKPDRRKVSAHLLLVADPDGKEVSIWWDIGGPLQCPVELVLVRYEPAPGGSSRQERRRPLAATRGWLRLSELPHGGQLRAAIVQAGAHSRRAIAVASLVESRRRAAPGSSSPPDLHQVQVRYQPTRRQSALGLVQAARHCQAVATPMAW